MSIADMDDAALERLMAAAAAHDSDDDDDMMYSTNSFLPQAPASNKQTAQVEPESAGPVLLGKAPSYGDNVAPSYGDNFTADVTEAPLPPKPAAPPPPEPEPAAPAFVLNLPTAADLAHVHTEPSSTDVFNSVLLSHAIDRAEASKLSAELKVFLGDDANSSRHTAMEQELRELRAQLAATKLAHDKVATEVIAANARAAAAESRALAHAKAAESAASLSLPASTGPALVETASHSAPEPVQVFNCSVPFDDEDEAPPAAASKGAGSKVTKVLRSLSFNRGRRGSRKE